MFAKFESYSERQRALARKVVINLGLANEKELSLKTDEEVEEIINKSGYVIFKSNLNYAILPHDVVSKITWVTLK